VVPAVRGDVAACDGYLTPRPAYLYLDYQIRPWADACEAEVIALHADLDGYREGWAALEAAARVERRRAWWRGAAVGVALGAAGIVVVGVAL